MSLKKLIDNQTIRIDDHKQGAGEIKNWDSNDDIHMDKITQYKVDGKMQSVQIKIPINSDKEVSVIAKNKKDEIPRKLKKEIVQALSDKKKRKDFIIDLIEILKNYESIMNNLDKVRDAMNRIAKHFDLHDWTKEVIESEITNTIKAKAIVRQYKDNDKKYYMLIDQTKIELGELNMKWIELLEKNDF